MKHKDLFVTLHSQFNVVEAKYDGFGVTLKLVCKYYGYTVTIGTDHLQHVITYASSDGEIMEPNKALEKFVKKLTKLISKRLKNYKDPFKYINGWA